MLQETFLKHKRKWKIKNYNIFRIDSIEGHNGIAILTKHNITASLYHLNLRNKPNGIQIQSIKITNHLIINIYNPNNVKLNKLFLKEICQNRDNIENIIIGGDFNSKNLVWGNNKNDHNGKLLVEVLLDENFICMNDGSATRISLPGQAISITDLTFCTSQLGLMGEWTTLPLDKGNSDHFPIIVKFRDTNMEVYNHNSTYPNTHGIKTQAYNTKKIDWRKYESLCQQIAQQTSDTSYENIINTIDKATDTLTPKKGYKMNKVNKQPTIWWDEECSTLVKNRRMAIQKYLQESSITNYINMNKTIALTKKILRIKKRTSFRNFCAGLNRDSNLSKTWRIIKRFNNVNTNQCKNNFIENNLDNFVDIMTIPDINFIPNITLNSDVKEQIPFSIDELNTTLNLRSKDTAPGADAITYSQLKFLPKIMKIQLLKHFNGILFGDPIPKDWQIQIICPILKPYKDPSQLFNYRFIALQSCVMKTFENLIKNRIEFKVESEGIISENQTGFRKGRGITDNLIIVQNRIINAFKNNNTVIIVYLDIKAAYDNVRIPILTNKLSKIKISQEIINVINRLFSRKIIIRDNISKTYSKKGELTKGLPQGSSLSPLLYNIYTNDIFNLVANGVEMLAYADDIILITEGKKMTDMGRSINETLQNLECWMKEHYLELSTEKSHAVAYSQRKIKQILPELRYNNDTIRYEKKSKYLGVVLDEKMKLVNHIDNITAKAQKGIDIMRSISGTWWGADPKVLMMIYKGLVRSHLDFGMILTFNTSQQNLNRLDRVQYRALRIILGAMKSSPIPSLLAETGELPLKWRRIWLAEKYILKHSSLTNSTIFKSLLNLYKNQHQIKNYINFPILEGLDKALVVYQKIKKFENLPCFLSEYESQFYNIPIVSLGLNKHSPNNLTFPATISEERNNSQIFYTDGSKNKLNRTGIGIYNDHKGSQFKVASRIANDHSICSAEMLAIAVAAERILQKQIPKALILSDSHSAIQKIQKRGLLYAADSIQLKARQTIWTAYKENIIIELGWIPSHTGIKGNEIADRLAKESLTKDDITFKLVEYKDILPNIKNDIKLLWEEEWKEISKIKGKQLFNLMNKLPSKPWFYEINLDRQKISTICRMRIGHCCTQQHLNKIGVSESPLCECGKIGNLQHILLECNINRPVRDKFYFEMLQCLQPSQSVLNLECMLSNPSASSASIICSFLK